MIYRSWSVVQCRILLLLRRLFLNSNGKRLEGGGGGGSEEMSSSLARQLGGEELGFVQVDPVSAQAKRSRRTAWGMWGGGVEGRRGRSGRWKRVLCCLVQVDGRGGDQIPSTHPRGESREGCEVVSHAEPRHSCKTPACKIYFLSVSSPPPPGVPFLPASTASTFPSFPLLLHAEGRWKILARSLLFQTRHLETSAYSGMTEVK